MYSVQPAMLELLTLCGVVAFILERAAAVLCGPKKAHGPATLLAMLPAPLPAWLGKMPTPPLRESATLACAGTICHALPLHLIATVKAGVVSHDIDTLVTALFITGLAQLIQQLLSRIAPGRAAAPVTPTNLVDFNPPAPLIPPATPAIPFKLGRLTPLAGTDHRNT